MKRQITKPRARPPADETKEQRERRLRREADLLYDRARDPRINGPYESGRVMPLIKEE